MLRAFGYELCRLERCHGLARACRVPDVAATVLVFVPVSLLNHVAYFADSKILVTTEYLQRLVLVVDNGVEAHHLVSHRDRQQICSVF